MNGWPPASQPGIGEKPEPLRLPVRCVKQLNAFFLSQPAAKNRKAKQRNEAD
jgi:hypothetical protein